MLKTPAGLQAAPIVPGKAEQPLRPFTLSLGKLFPNIRRVKHRTMKNILIIDNNEKSSRELEQFLEREGYTPSVVNNAEEGLCRIVREEPAVVLLEAALPDMSALEALERIKHKHRQVDVIMIGADAGTTIESMRLGAFDVVLKPVNLDNVKLLLDRSFQMRAVHNTLPVKPTDEPATGQNGHQLVGQSESMHEIYKLIGITASNTIAVLIEGETGTGKDLVARAIHARSARKEQAFIPVDCGALPDQLLESELFGYDAGAFTGAKEQGKPGRFELADGGTLFLDEVGNMSSALQVKLLRALQTQEIERLGGTRTIKVDVRVIAATNQDLGEMVKRGAFREDLYYRLKRIALQLPPLRERRKDIPLLVTHFLHLTEAELGRPIRGISKEGMKLLQDYSWPGNVRELENCIRSTAALSRSGVILRDDLPPEIQEGICANATHPPQLESAFKEEISETQYKNLFDLPAPVFCLFVSRHPNITMEQITDWSTGLTNGARVSANETKREVDNWRIEWATDQLTYPDLLMYIKETVENAIPQLSQLLRGGTDLNLTKDANPVSIEGRTFYSSLEAVLMELEKEYGDDRAQLTKVLALSAKQLDVELKKIKEIKEKFARQTAGKSPGQPQQRCLKDFPEEEVKRFLTDPVRSYVGYLITGNEWRAKDPTEKIRTIRMAFQVLAKRFQGYHGYIRFGGMTFQQIREDIYRRATYLYATESEVAKALKVDLRTFRKYSPHQEGNFPEYYTLF